MTIKKFIIKITIKVIVFAIISTIALTLLESPIISNNIALGQMQNDDTLFILMEIYNKVRPYITVVYSLIVICFAYTVGYDTYKFIKTKTKEKEENEKN